MTAIEFPKQDLTLTEKLIDVWFFSTLFLFLWGGGGSVHNYWHVSLKNTLFHSNIPCIIYQHKPDHTFQSPLSFILLLSGLLPICILWFCITSLNPTFKSKYIYLLVIAVSVHHLLQSAANASNNLIAVIYEIACSSDLLLTFGKGHALHNVSITIIKCQRHQIRLFHRRPGAL